jgi:hypothetical protein
VLAFLIAASAGLYGCGPPDGEIRLDHSIAFDGVDGTRILKIVPRKGRVNLQDAKGEPLARFKLDEGGLRIERAPRELIGFVAPAASDGKGLQLLASAKGDVLYRLVSEPDGDLRLENGQGSLLYKMKKRDYGFKTVDAMDRVQSRVRVKKAKVSVRDAAGRTTLSTDDPIPAAAVACFTLPNLPVEHQTGLVLAVIHWGPGAL